MERSGSTEGELCPTNPDQITCAYVTSAEVDGNIENVLRPFRETGRDWEYGIVLILKMPDSRYVNQ